MPFSRAFANTRLVGATAAKRSDASLPNFSPKLPGRNEIALHSR
jgi:hypothetical protein